MHRGVRLLFLLSALMGPVLLHGQFQKPTEEELKMTSDPKAPGADAVYLYREEKTDDTLHFHSYYVRIKVLTEKGKELATVRIPYEKGKFEVAAIQGRTIRSDGTVVPLLSKPSDLLDSKNGGRQFNQMVFNLPGVEVGSILEYRLQLRYSDDSVSEPEWIISQPYYVHKAHYQFNPVYNANRQVVDKHNQVVDGLLYASRLGDGQQVARDSQNRYTVDVSDVPALPDEDYMPPLNTIRYRVIFYYINSASVNEYWATEGKYWAASAIHFIAASGPIKKAAGDLVSSGDSDDQKARKIYAAVMKLDNRDFSASKGSNYKPSKDAGAVWKQQSGSSDELALLYVAMARAIGLNAWPMQVVNRNRATFENSYLNSDQLDDFIAITQIDGKAVYLDPGQKMCAFGDLHWKHEVATGFRLTDKGAILDTTPASPAKSATIKRVADLSVDDQGNLKGAIRIVMSGPEALYWRQLAILESQGELKKDFNDSLSESLLEGVHAELDHFEALDSPEPELVAVARVAGNLGSPTATRLILPAFFFEARAKHPFVAEKTRSTPVDLHYARMEHDEVTYHLPPGSTLGGTPKPADVGWTGHISMQTGFATKGNDLVATRNLVRNSVVLELSEYLSLREIYQQITGVDQQQIVLSRAAAAPKGN